MCVGESTKSTVHIHVHVQGVLQRHMYYTIYVAVSGLVVDLQLLPPPMYHSYLDTLRLSLSVQLGPHTLYV